MDIDELIGKPLQDEYLRYHEIVGVLGEGGQGVVCLTQDPCIVIKLALNTSGKVISKKENSEEYEEYTKEVKYLNKMPFPDNIHIAYPMAVLTNYAGYVMRLMDDMTSFGSLMDINKYHHTGGHRRRFEILSKLASILTELHSNGLVYCDLSPNNVFITKEPSGKNQNVWLIDADNVNYGSANDGRLVYTKRYAAPEIITQESICSMASDSYSYATLAFETLAAIHPFDGALVKEAAGDVVGWDTTVTKNTTANNTNLIYSGTIPWIEDPNDLNNHTQKGFPREIFLNMKLFILFNQTFSEGRLNPQLRPPMYFWAKAMADAADTTIKCKESNCNMSHLFNETQNKCPFCGQELPPILIIKESERVIFTREITVEPISIPERVFIDFNHKTNAEPYITISFEKHGNESVCMIKKQFNINNNIKIYLDEVENKIELKSTITKPVKKNEKIIIKNGLSGKERIFDLSVKGVIL